jgi:MYXO-CTERM domain-containing protein
VDASGAPFTVTPPTLPASLKGDAGNNAQFTVTATPTDTGEVTQSITLMTDIPGGAPHVVTVDVTGLTAGVSATPDLLDFGSNPIDTTTVGQQVQLSNCSTDPITASNPTITGVDAAEFAVVASPPSPGIAPTALASWLIVFSGHTAGIKNATFSIDYDGGTASVPLTAEVLSSTPGGGSGSDGGGDTGKDTYYACSAGGGPLGLAPLLLVMFFAVRTRRRT